MQCAVCHAVYSNALDNCPRCKRPATNSAAAPTPEKSRATASPTPRASSSASANRPVSNRLEESAEAATATAVSSDAGTQAATASPPSGSTLIEFPGTGRQRPQWRKELSERVREIQQRRAREAREAEEAERGFVSEPEEVAQTDEAAASVPPLGLVPREEAPELNPIVAAALRRLERARRPIPPPPMPRSGGRAKAAAAVATRYEEAYQSAPVHVPAAPPVAATRPAASAQAAPTVEAQRIAPAPQVETQKTVPQARTEKTPEAQTEKTHEAARPSSLVSLASQTPTRPAPPNGKAEAPTINALATSAPAATPTTATGAAVAPKRSAPVVEAEQTERKSTLTTSVAASPEAAAATPVLDEATTERTNRPAPAKPASKPATTRRISTVADEISLERRDSAITDAANFVPVIDTREAYDDHAPLSNRVVAAIVDLFVVAFFSSPFAAIIELTSGRWHDPRVVASMGGIIVLVMFLYLMGSTALAGYTWGMSLFSLRAVDARSAMAPTTGQAIRRALFYLLSLATAGLPLLYAFFDAEGRTTHDYLSGTIIVRE